MQNRNPHHPAYLNPQEMTRLGLREGDSIRIKSDNGQILGTVGADPGIRPGVISMCHGCGGVPDGKSADGDIVSVLISTGRSLEAINWQPRMSAITVNIHLVNERVGAPAFSQGSLNPACPDGDPQRILVQPT